MKLLLIFSMSVIGIGCFAQSSINSTGNSISTGEYQLDYTVGILTPQVLSSDSGNVYPGVIQPGSKSGTGISEFSSIGFGIYPNPASNTIYFTGWSSAHTVGIFDALGKRIDYMLIEPSEPVDIARLANGVYTVVTDKQSFKLLKTN